MFFGTLKKNKSRVTWNTSKVDSHKKKIQLLLDFKIDIWHAPLELLALWREGVCLIDRLCLYLFGD